MRHSKNYRKKRKRTLKALTALSDEKTANAIAVDLGVWPSEVRRALSKGYVSPALVRAVVKPRHRPRFAADVSPELRAELRAEAEALELTNGELLELMFGNWIIYDEVTE